MSHRAAAQAVNRSTAPAASGTSLGSPVEPEVVSTKAMSSGSRGADGGDDASPGSGEVAVGAAGARVGAAEVPVRGVEVPVGLAAVTAVNAWSGAGAVGWTLWRHPARVISRSRVAGGSVTDGSITGRRARRHARA